MNLFYERILCCQGRRAGKHLKTPGSFLLCDLRLLGSDLYQRGGTGMQWCQTSPPSVVGSLVEKPVLRNSLFITVNYCITRKEKPEVSWLQEVYSVSGFA